MSAGWHLAALIVAAAIIMGLRSSTDAKVKKHDKEPATQEHAPKP